jgi:hypothetical protein
MKNAIPSSTTSAQIPIITPLLPLKAPPEDDVVEVLITGGAVVVVGVVVCGAGIPGESGLLEFGSTGLL